jgi:hypothetical protein
MLLKNERGTFAQLREVDPGKSKEDHENYMVSCSYNMFHLRIDYCDASTEFF